MKLIGVIGAGVMGRGLAHVIAQSGFKVVLVDLNEEILEKARNEIYKNVQMQILYKKSTVKPKEVIDNICFTTDYNKLKDVDYLIENTNENIELKKEIFRKLNNICRKECIFAINTSCISITKIAAITNYPDKIIGIHFMNPVPMKPAVEVIKGYHTSEETIEATKEFLSLIEKKELL